MRIGWTSSCVALLNTPTGDGRFILDLPRLRAGWHTPLVVPAPARRLVGEVESLAVAPDRWRSTPAAG